LPPERRRIVLDEDINWKLMHELRGRGRADATAVKAEGLDGRKDAALFKILRRDYEPYVLVTYDNKMPAVHAAEMAHHETTVAVVSEAAFRRKGGDDPAPYIRDVIHRWLHRIEAQPAGSRRRYSPSGSTPD
jgi:hypothetical protein